MKKIKNGINNINKKNVGIMILGYLLIVGILASQLNKIFCPVWGDVLLYNEEAKSLADSGTIKFANMYGISGAYLYPFLLSFVYKYFYNPYTITFTTRLLGILLMTSSIFPAYCLLKKMKFQGKKLLFLSFATIIIPDIMQTWLTVTEVLAYPLFMWTIYVFYLDIEIKEHCKATVALAILCYLDYMTRGQSLVIALAYVGSTIWYLIYDYKKNVKENLAIYLKKLISFVCSFGLLYILVPKILKTLGVISDVQDLGASYATTAIHNFLSSPGYYIAEWGIGCAWYLFYIVLAFGFLTIVLPFFYRNYNDNERKLVIFINMILLLTIVIVVLIIYTLEEPLGIETHRIHMRYFMFFYAPYLFLLYKIDFQKFKWNNIYSFISILFILFICFGRYIYSIRENSFLGAEGMALTIYRIAKERLTLYPALESWLTIFTLLIILVLVYVLKMTSWKRFMQYIFPCVIIIITMSNILLYTHRDRYLTEIGQGDYISRYAPVADYLREYDSGEVVLVIRALCDDNEMQTLQCIMEKSVDVISLGELDLLCSNSNNVRINEFDRTGYFYLTENTHRILYDAKCIVFSRAYLDGYRIYNDVAYQDENFVVYNLDNGSLYVDFNGKSEDTE